jgi:hypothetical protein
MTNFQDAIADRLLLDIAPVTLFSFEDLQAAYAVLKSFDRLFVAIEHARANGTPVALAANRFRVWQGADPDVAAELSVYIDQAKAEAREFSWTGRPLPETVRELYGLAIRVRQA